MPSTPEALAESLLSRKGIRGQRKQGTQRELPVQWDHASTTNGELKRKGHTLELK